MSTQSGIRKLFEKSFSESTDWTDWYFNNVYSDGNAMISYVNSQPASCLMLDRYKFKIASQQVGMSYISCCATAPQFRGHGHMSRLLIDALLESAAGGAAFASLIPANRRLYFYYDRLGFSTVFYSDEQRYTSLHSFRSGNDYIELSPSYDAFHALECGRTATVIHSATDFDNILADNRLDSGIVIYKAEKETSKPAAMLFATVGQHAAVVRDPLSASEAASESALASLRERIGERMIIVHTLPGENPFYLKSHGMVRIVNPLPLFEAIGAEHPSTEQVIRLRDPIIPDNNAVFIIHGGHVERSNSTMRRITLDVNVDILAKIIFNSRRVGDIFSIPSFRPSMSLMLD